MTDPAGPTLRTLSGLPTGPASLGGSTLVLIDLQETYTRGVMELEGHAAAIDEAAALLDRARTAGTPVVHVRHDSGVGSPYDVTAEIGQIVAAVAPREGEPVVTKAYPNSFTGTELHDRLTASAATDLLLVGFMSHMCVSSTARGAFSLGYAPTVVASATATRALPAPDGTVVAAAALQAASLAAVADLFGVVVPRQSDVPG